MIIRGQHLYTSMRTLALGSLVLAMVCSVAYVVRPLGAQLRHSGSEVPSAPPAPMIASMDQQPVLDSHYFSDKAFITIVNGELQVDRARVSVHSLCTVATRARVLVAVSPNVSENATQALSSIGPNVMVIKAEAVDDLVATALWNVVPVTIRKVVYFTTDIMFRKNVDHYFDYVAHTALNDEQDQVGMQVLERLQKAHTMMPEALPLADQEVHWFNGPMKPWDFHQYHGADWHMHYDPLPFYHWRQMHDELTVGDSDISWANQDRRRMICEENIPAALPNGQPMITDRFSVLLSTYTPERIQRLTLLIEHLQKSSLVHTIFVTWHNPHLKVPDELLHLEGVSILQQSYDSLNNRFNPVNAIQTEAVYVIDDDMLVDIHDIEFTFEIWRLNKDSIVGHFPRIHSYNPETHKALYKVSNHDAYSMILTKSMFARTDYLFAYTCLLDKSLQRKIDDWTNCEDIAFNMMVSGMTHARSIAVTPAKPIIDYGRKKGISTTKHHMKERSTCSGRFITEYWDAVDPLVVSHSAEVPYTRPNVKNGNWDSMQSDISSLS